VTTIPKLASSVVGEYNVLLALITNDARLGIRNLSAAWQLQLQESPVAFECNWTAPKNTAALGHGSPSRAINVVPESHDGSMRYSPLAFELLNFSVCKFLRFEFTPSIEAAHVTECEVADLTDAALRTFFV
jgi:hypothetical protein